MSAMTRDGCINLVRCLVRIESGLLIAAGKSTRLHTFRMLVRAARMQAKCEDSLRES